MKKSLALILALIMLLSLAACKGNTNSENANSEMGEKPVIVMTVPSSASWPVDEEWVIWDYMEEGAGVELDLRAIPEGEVATKYTVMFTSPETLPDVVAFTGPTGYRTFHNQGALIAFEDLEEYMPAYNAWVDGLSEDEYNQSVKVRKAADGKIYYSPSSGREGVVGARCWLYRQDIFEKHNLSTPTTFNELYEVCRELKSLYPDSYPLAIRGGFDCIDAAAPSFEKWWNHLAYYDFDAEKWYWGAREEAAVEIVEFYKKMYDEKLIPLDFVTLAPTSWEELIVTDRGFITPHFQTRIDFFVPLVKDNNPNFKLQAFKPPVANPERGVPALPRRDVESVGVSISNTMNEERIANAARFVDWYYTDEGKQLLSWGKEGETYEVVNGKKKFITDEKGNPLSYDVPHAVFAGTAITHPFLLSKAKTHRPVL